MFEPGRKRQERRQISAESSQSASQKENPRPCGTGAGSIPAAAPDQAPRTFLRSAVVERWCSKVIVTHLPPHSAASFASGRSSMR